MSHDMTPETLIGNLCARKRDAQPHESSAKRIRKLLEKIIRHSSKRNTEFFRQIAAFAAHSGQQLTTVPTSE